MFIPVHAHSLRSPPLVVMVFLAVVTGGCHRYPTLDAPRMASLLQGQVVPSDHANGAWSRWQFGPLDPSSIIVRDVDQDGKLARVVVDLRTAGHGDATGSVSLGDGRLRVSVEWIADRWTVMRIENLSFEVRPARCAMLFPPANAPWSAIPDLTLFHLLVPSYDYARERATVTRAPGPEPVFRAATCAGGTVHTDASGRFVMRGRQTLPDGRLAVFIRTQGQDDEGNGGGEPVEELGALVLLEHHDQAVVAVQFGDWESANRVVPTLRVEHLNDETIHDEHLAEQTVFLEPAPERGTNDSPDDDGVRIWVGHGLTLDNVGRVPVNTDVDLSCVPAIDEETPNPPWHRRTHSTLDFTRGQLVVHDDTTWERGRCAAASVPPIHPIVRHVERHYALHHLQLRALDHEDETPPPVR